MAEFSELVKNFSKCRDYVRDFFVYGFKSRQDFTSDKKSARTYDDERRRIESWLSDYVVEELAEQTTRTKVKNISLQMDSNLLDTNPLFAVWRTKSFTDNDILLHFYLFDLLHNSNDAYSANEIADLLSEDYSFAADTQLVRRKCNEYVKEGLLATEKDGKTLLYRRGMTWDELCSDIKSQDDHCSALPEAACYPKSLNDALIHAISLFQLDSPFGYIGNTILSRLSEGNSIFRIKHSFPVFTLEDEIAYVLLDAINNHSYVQMDVQSNKVKGIMKPLSGIPVKFMVSSRTGRRYICIYKMIHERTQIRNGVPDNPKFHFHCIRLDQIKSVTPITRSGATKEKMDPNVNTSSPAMKASAKGYNTTVSVACTKKNSVDTVEGEQDIDKSIQRQIAIRQTIDAYTKQQKSLLRNLDYVWGVSFKGTKTKVSLTLHINEQSESFILNRLESEGKNGTVTKLTDNTFLYEKVVFDANEMFPWLRTFIGRILDVHFHTINQDGIETTENITLRKRFLNDIEKLYELYETDI